MTLIASSISLLLLVAGWCFQKEAVAFVVIEPKQLCSLSSSSHSFNSYGAIYPYQFDSDLHQRISSSKFQPGYRLSSSKRKGSSSSSLEEKPIDEFDTLETLSDLLVNLMSTNKTDVCATKDQHFQRQQRILTTRLSNVRHTDPKGRNINIYRTYVGNSTIGNAGLGLFARRDFPKGTLLTCYPGDALVDLTKDGNVFKEISGQGRVTWGSHVMKATCASFDKSDGDCDDDSDSNSVNNPECRLREEYMLRAVYDHWGIVAMPELFGDSDPTYLGHFANDGVRCPPTRESELAAYVIESTDRANAMHQPCKDCHMVTIATRDIKAREEIFVTYGPDYWREQALFVQSVTRNDDEDFDSTHFDDFDDFDSEHCYEGEEHIESEIPFLSDGPLDSQGKGFG